MMLRNFLTICLILFGASSIQTFPYEMEGIIIYFISRRLKLRFNTLNKFVFVIQF